MINLKMSKLIITLWTDTKLAKETLKGWQYLVYRSRLESLYRLICNRLGRNADTTTKKDSKNIYVEDGEKDYIKLQKRKLEAFLFSDSSELMKKEYNKYVNDRWIQKVSRNVHKLKDKIKDKALRSALGGTDILGFMTRIGIFVKWEIEDLD